MPIKHNENMFKESIEDANRLLKKAIEFYALENYKNAIDNLSLAHKIFLAHKDIPNVSVCLSLNGLIKYIEKSESYYKSLLLLEDSKFLAESSNNKTIIAVNKFAFGQIYFLENKYNEALFYLSYASTALKELPILQAKAYEILALIYIKMQNTKMAYESLEKAYSIAQHDVPQYLFGKIKELSRNFIDSNSGVEKITQQTNKKQPEKEQNETLLIALSEIARTVNAQANLDKLLIKIA